MSMKAGIDKAFTNARIKTLLVLLPDTCEIQPTEGTDQSFANGYVTQTPATLRTYNSLTDIPCRFDPSRAFRPSRLQYEPTEVLEYNIELPFDVVIESTDIIIVDSERYSVMKMTMLTSYDITRQVLLMKAGKNVDL